MIEVSLGTSWIFMLLSLILIWKLLTQKSRKLQSRLNFIAEKQGYMQPDCHLSSVLPFFVLVLGGRDTFQEFCVQALALSTSPPSFGP